MTVLTSNCYSFFFTKLMALRDFYAIYTESTISRVHKRSKLLFLIAPCNKRKKEFQLRA